MRQRIAPIVHLSTSPIPAKARALFGRRPLVSSADPERLPLRSHERAVGWLLWVRSEGDEALLLRLAGRAQIKGCPPGLVLYPGRSPSVETVNGSARLGALAILAPGIEAVASSFSGRLDAYVATQRARWGLVDLASAPLSRRELSVAELALEGWSHDDIGEALGISRRTVEAHMRRVMAKHGLRGRIAELRARCARHWC